MNFDELVQKYLDNNINTWEQKALDDIVSNSPEYAEEFHMLKKVEMGLTTAKTRMNSFDIAFLSNVGEKITSVARAPVSPLNPVRSPFASFFHNNMILISLGMLTLAIIFGLFVITNSNVPAPAKVTSVKIPVMPKNQSGIETKVEKSSDIVENNDIPSNPIIAAPVQVVKNIDTAYIADANTKSKFDMQLLITEKNLQKNNEVIQKLYTELNNYEASGDKQMQALTLLRLGTLLRQINGREDEGKKNLLKSLAITNNLNNPELQGEIYGELGIIEIKSGSKPTGIDYLEKCVKTLESLDPKRLAHWKDILEKNR